MAKPIENNGNKSLPINNYPECNSPRDRIAEWIFKKEHPMICFL